MLFKISILSGVSHDMSKNGWKKKGMSCSFPDHHLHSHTKIKVCSWIPLTSLKNKHIINSNIFDQITLESIWQKSACINMPALWLLQTKLTTKLKHFYVTNWRQRGGRGKVSITMHSLKEPLNINKHVIFTSDCRARESMPLEQTTD